MNKIKSQIVFKGDTQVIQKPKLTNIDTKVDIGKIMENKIKVLQEELTDTFQLVRGNLNLDQCQFNDDIKREQEFYKQAHGNLKYFSKQFPDVQLSRPADDGFLFKKVGQVVHNGILKQTVYIQNEDEKELRAQGKRLQQMIQKKSMDEEKQQKLVEQIKKALSRHTKDNEDEELNELPETQHRKNKILKKGFKQKKGKRMGKTARLQIRLKKNSRK